MSVEQVVKCDVCQEPGSARYKVQVDGEHWDVDLCADHAAPMMEIARHGRRAGSTVGGVDPATRFRSLESLIEDVPVIKSGE